MTALGVLAGRHDVVAIFRPPTPSKNDLVMFVLTESGFLGEAVLLPVELRGFNCRRSPNRVVLFRKHRSLIQVMACAPEALITSAPFVASQEPGHFLGGRRWIAATFCAGRALMSASFAQLHSVDHDPIDRDAE
jgi:hypothetical protein